MGIQYLLKAITANNDDDMLQILDEFDEVLELARALETASYSETLPALN